MSEDVLVEFLKRYSNLGESPAELGARLERSPGQPIVDDLGGTRRVQKHVRLAEGEIQALIDAYAAGGRVIDLAQRFGVHPDTVRAKVDALGLRRRVRRFSEAESQEAIRLFEAGVSRREVARRFGVSQGTILRRVAPGANHT